MLQFNQSEEITLKNISTGDNALDAIFFIKNMFSQKQLTPEQKVRVLQYLLSEIPNSKYLTQEAKL